MTSFARIEMNGIYLCIGNAWCADGDGLAGDIIQVELAGPNGIRYASGPRFRDYVQFGASVAEEWPLRAGDRVRVNASAAPDGIEIETSIAVDYRAPWYPPPSCQ